MSAGVTIRPRADFEKALGELSGKTVAVDPNFGVAAIYRALIDRPPAK